MNPGVTVCIAAIPPRIGMFTPSAVDSVLAQTRLPEAILIELDLKGEKEPVVRNRLISKVETEWLAWVDDDDYLHPQHLATLWNNRQDADLIYPWFEVEEGTDPWPGIEGTPFDREKMLTEHNFVPVTYLLRTELARQVGFPLKGPGWPRGADWKFHHRLLEAGARYLHVPERTWTWRHGSHRHARTEAWTDWDTADA